MDDGATARGVAVHRVLHAFESLAVGFERMGLSRRTAERLAEAHVLRLERDRFFATRHHAAPPGAGHPGTDARHDTT